jgi:thymidylate kinase
MHKVEKDCLVDLFKTITDKYEYVVLRNADELPYDNFSNDVDILIDHDRYDLFEKKMKSIFLKHGFKRMERTSFFGIECYTFYNIENEKAYSLKIDLFFNIEGGGVKYYDFKEVITYKKKNTNGIYVFESNVEAYVTALKTFAAGGVLKEKYLSFFIENRLESEHSLYQKCPSKSLKQCIDFLIGNHKNPNSVSRRKIVTETWWSNFKTNPLKAVMSVLQHYMTEVSRMFKKQYMIVLVGPDGSGKTTMIERLQKDSKETLRSIPERIHMFHHRPHLFPNISDIFKKNISEEELTERTFSPHSGKESNKIVSFIKLLYYAMDYRLGYIIKVMPLQRKNKFIVFDRYFFDFIVDQKRSALKISDKIALGIYNVIIPKPNKVLFIKADPLAAHNRKKELPEEVIKQINDSYDKMANRYDYFKIIVNDDLEAAYSNFTKSFIETLTERVDG